jgi:hypothetical protein
MNAVVTMEEGNPQPAVGEEIDGIIQAISKFAQVTT